MLLVFLVNTIRSILVQLAIKMKQSHFGPLILWFGVQLFGTIGEGLPESANEADLTSDKSK